MPSVDKVWHHLWQGCRVPPWCMQQWYCWGIKTSIRWKNDDLFMYYRRFLCVPHPSHAHLLAVEWYSSHLDEILTVSQPSLLTGSAFPPPFPSASFPCRTALSMFSHPDRCFSHLGLKMRKGRRWYPLCRYNSLMALDHMKGSQPQWNKCKMEAERDLAFSFQF